MAVRCPQCGHEYDVTLFQFGRTVTCDCGATVSLGPVPAVAPPARRRWTRRRKVLTGCGTLAALVLLAAAAAVLWAYYAWHLNEPDPRPTDHYVGDDIDAFAAVNIAPDDTACRQLAQHLLELAGFAAPGRQLPRWLAGELDSDDTLLDAPGVLPARLAVYYRCVEPASGDEAFVVASFPQLPLQTSAAAAAGLRLWARSAARADPASRWYCHGAPAVRLQWTRRTLRPMAGGVYIPQVKTCDLHVSLLSRTAFASDRRAGLGRAIQRFRSPPAGGPSGALVPVCAQLDFASDLVAAARNQDKEIRRLLRMTEDTPPDELPPDEFMLMNYGIDPDAMLGVGLQVEFETADRARCRGLILCPDPATAETFTGLAADFIPRIGKPWMTCKVTGSRASGPMVHTDFIAEGLRIFARAMATPGAFGPER